MFYYHNLKTKYLYKLKINNQIYFIFFTNNKFLSFSYLYIYF